VTAVTDTFARCKAEGRAALVGYLPACFPTPERGVKALRAMVEGGVDMVEVGLPYSDPVLEGPTIAQSHDIALRAGSTTAHVLRTVEAVAATGVPVVVMTYWNPVERYGVDRFAADLANAGGSGLITPDLLPTALTASSSSPPARPTSGSPSPPAFAAASSTRRRSWASPAPAPRPAPTRPSWSPARAPTPTCQSASGLASATPTRPPRWPASPTR
jgi:hypothetical protein